MGLNICLDTGHANLNEGVDTAFRLLRSRIRSTHLHDNNGKDDSHLFPMVAEGGVIDWTRAMQGLRAQELPLVLELREVPEMAHPLDQVKLVFERLEGLQLAHEQ